MTLPRPLAKVTHFVMDDDEPLVSLYCANRMDMWKVHAWLSKQLDLARTVHRTLETTPLKPLQFSYPEAPEPGEKECH